MKRIFSLLLIVVVILVCASCSKDNASTKTEKEPTKVHNNIITEAISELKDYWQDLYAEPKAKTDGYFEIKNTRVITIQNNEIDLFSDVEYIIEFQLYTDYMGSAPYYENVGAYDNVVVYKNGKMDVTTSLIRQYRNGTFETDYSDFISSIDDYQGYYNCVERLK